MPHMARRGHGEGSFYLRADGYWCASVRLPGGKRIVRYARTKKEAASKLGDLAGKRRMGRLSAPTTSRAPEGEARNGPILRYRGQSKGRSMRNPALKAMVKLQDRRARFNELREDDDGLTLVAYALGAAIIVVPLAILCADRGRAPCWLRCAHRQAAPNRGVRHKAEGREKG